MKPQKLEKGDKIGIVAFAKKITLEEVLPAVKVFESWGLQVVIGNTVGSAWNQFSATDKERANDIQTMLDNPEIKAIVSARGGYGSVRIIDAIDFSNFKRNPKWLVGFSDVTVFHSHIHQYCDIATIHGSMPVFFQSNTKSALNTLKQALMEDEMIISHQSKLISLCKNGTTQAEIIGGNLSILYSLCGSSSNIKTSGKILFLEDLCEYLYHTDRMLQNLKRNGFFDDLAGVIVGSFTDMKDGPVPFGSTAEELIYDYIKHTKGPIITDFPAGHIDDNRALIFGQKAKFTVTNGNAQLVF